MKKEVLYTYEWKEGGVTRKMEIAPSYVKSPITLPPGMHFIIEPDPTEGDIENDYDPDDE